MFIIVVMQDGVSCWDIGAAAVVGLLGKASELHGDALIRQVWTSRRGMMLLFRRAHEARRDARLVFRAAAEGRPLELQRRLVLGKLAGGLDILGEVDSVIVTPLDAARAGGHGECIRMLCKTRSNESV